MGHFFAQTTRITSCQDTCAILLQMQGKTDKGFGPPRAHLIKRFERVGAVFLVLLLAAASLIFINSQPAAAAADGKLTVRATSVACGFTNVIAPNLRTQCADIADHWYPSETANRQAILEGTGTPVANCGTSVGITEAVQNIGVSSVAARDLTCNERTHSTDNLLASIFSGVDANNQPDLPVVGGPWSPAAPTKCEVADALVTDIAPATCGVGGISRTTAEWYIMEGYVRFPATASGQITFEASNLGRDNTSRAEYLAFMASPDRTFANLAFVGEAETARNSTVGLQVSVNVSTDVGDRCSNIRGIRLYMQDQIEGSSANLRWDIGNGMVPIPAANVGTNNDPLEGCMPPVAENNEETTNPGVAVDIPVLGNDTKGSGDIDPTTVRFLDPISGDRMESLVVPGEGTWSVDTATGVVTFTPLPEFTGVTAPVNYEFFDGNGLSARAEVVVTVNAGPTPSTEPATDPTTDAATDPATEPATDPATDAATDPTTDPMKDPTQNPTTNPVAVLTNGSTSQSNKDDLATTGSSAKLLITGGGLLLALGLVGLFMSTRRRSQH